MTNDDYETVLGKLTILKLFLTTRYWPAVDELIEGLETEYLERRNNHEL